MIGKTFKHYKILKKIGQGGMGEVYLANDTSLHRKVAMKFLPPELGNNPSAHRRFIREAKSAAAIDHPYICHINEVGESEGNDFIVMEYVEGQTLQEKLEQGPLPIKEALQIAMEVVEALEEAHAKGIIHRDLKPANIMLTTNGHAKVMDFGLAKQVSDSGEIELQEETLSAITQSGAILGTPAYMSPEQFQGKPADARSDLFSFGIVLYEMLTGTHPFRQLSMLETVSYILTKPPHPLDLTKYHVPKDLKAILKKLLSKDPLHRYQSAHELRIDLAESLRDKQSSLAGFRILRPIKIFLAFTLLAMGIFTLVWWIWDNYFLSPQAALAFQERDWIIIADFENLTGDELFDQSLQTALRVAIQQSQYVNVYPPPLVQKALQRMRREPTEKLDESLACEVAVREGVKAVLVCSIGEIGGVYSLTARLVEPNKRTTVLSESANANDKAQVLPVLDLFVRIVRQNLGESIRKITNQTPLPQATTESLEALKLYADGKQLLYSDENSGIQLFKQALAIDPEFALAHAEMGMQLYQDNARAAGEEHFVKALSLLNRLTMRERLWISALTEDWRGDMDSAIESYKIYLSQYPDDAQGWFRLGWLYMARGGEFAKSIEAFENTLKIDRFDYSSRINIAACYSGLGQYEKSVENYEQVFELSPQTITSEFVNEEYGFTLIRLGQLSKSEEVFNKMVAVDELWKKARGFRHLALLALYRGKISEAISNLKQSIRINKAENSATSEFRDRMYLACMYRLNGDFAAFTSEIEEANRLLSQYDFAPTWIARLAKTYARMGEKRKASVLYQEMTVQEKNLTAFSGIDRTDKVDQANISMIKGELDLADGNIADAIESFKYSLQLNRRDTGLMESLATAYQRDDRLEEAAGIYEDILSRFQIGREDQEVWIRAHFELGSIYQELGKVEKAKESYKKLLDLWAEADPGIPLLENARKQYSTLN